MKHMMRMRMRFRLISLVCVLFVISMVFTACGSRSVEVEEEETRRSALLFLEKEASGSPTTYHRVAFRHPDTMSEEDKAATILPTPVMLEAGASLYDAPIPEREGYVFEGWYYDSEMTKPVSEEDILTENTILYPHMIPSVSAFALE